MYSWILLLYNLGIYLTCFRCQGKNNVCFAPLRCISVAMLAVSTLIHCHCPRALQAQLPSIISAKSPLPASISGFLCPPEPARGQHLICHLITFSGLAASIFSKVNISHSLFINTAQCLMFQKIMYASY